MSDLVTVRCSSCGKGYRIGRDKLGRRSRCTGCGTTITLVAEEAPAPAPWLASSSASSPSPSKPAAGASAGGKSGGSAWAQLNLLQKAGSVAVFIVLCAVFVGLKWRSTERRHERAREGGRHFDGPGTSTPSARPTPAPARPATPVAATPVSKAPVPLTFAEENGRQVGRAITAGKAQRTEVRLYLPAGASDASPVPCVFVAPAGSNLLTGVPFGDDEHEDFLPLLEHGMAVCFYSLAGSAPADRELNDMQMALMVQMFVNADGGLHNLRDAIDCVLASAPGVDPARLAVCGHSSSGTIALTAVGQEPRIKAAAVMAPAIDLPERFGEEFMNSAGSELTGFVRTHSPSRIPPAGKVFIYHAADDQNIPVAEAQAYAARHANDVTLQVAPTGGHVGAYLDGLQPCFQFLAITLNAKPTTESNGVGSASGSVQAGIPAPAAPPQPTTETNAARSTAPVRSTRGVRQGQKTKDPVPPTLATDLGERRALRFRSMAVPIENVPRPDDKRLGPTQMGSPDFSIRLDPPPGFVVRSDNVIRIRAERGADDYVPRLRYKFFHEGQGLFLVSTQDAAQPDGVLQTVLGMGIVAHVPQAQAREVPFLTPNGRGLCVEMQDRDGGVETDEYLIAGKMGTYYGLFHAITARGDIEGMQELKALIDSFKAK